MCGGGGYLGEFSGIGVSVCGCGGYLVTLGSGRGPD